MQFHFLLIVVNITKIISNNRLNEITVYSYERSSTEKAIAYSFENARKKVYPKFAKVIDYCITVVGFSISLFGIYMFHKALY